MYLQKILSEFNLNIKIAGEIEFYIEPSMPDEKTENEFQEKILAALVKENIQVWNMQKEVAPNQYEIALQPTTPDIAAKQINKLKELIAKVLESSFAFQYTPIFKAKPYATLPGCGLHIHIGITDLNDNSAIERQGPRGNKEGETEIMLHAIGGLCSTMLKNFTSFAPTQKSYLRFSAQRNELKDVENPLATYNNAPVNVSWGGNNRTTAIRIPASSYDESNRHIEHRVAGADANPDAVINAILEGVYIGLKDKITPPEKIHGNAFDKQYDFLKPFPKTLEEANKPIL